MARFPFLHYLLLMVLVAGTNVLPGRAQSQTTAPVLTIEEVVKLWKTPLSEELIVTMIKKNGKPFNLSTDEVLELRSVGISETIVKLLLDPSQPYTPAPPPPPPPPPGPDSPKPCSANANGAQIPNDPGLYRSVEGMPVKIDIRLVLGEKQGAGLGKFIMKKGKVIGYLLESTSKARIQEATPVFYMRLPEGKAIEEVVLVALEQKNDRREIEMGPTPDKQELKAEAMRPFDSVEVCPRVLYKITTSRLTKGEYMFLLLGSAEPPKGSYGKGYDFGVEESER